MTFENFVSNKEQVEAHFHAYAKVWNDGCAAALVSRFPGITLVELLELRGVGFEYYLTDVHLGIQLKDAPAEIRRDFSEFPTPSCIVRNLMRLYAEL